MGNAGGKLMSACSGRPEDDEAEEAKKRDMLNGGLDDDIDEYELQKQFDMIDLDGSGTIDKEEFVEWLVDEEGEDKYTDEMVDAAFNAVDKNNSGMIDFEEFMTLNKQLKNPPKPGKPPNPVLAKLGSVWQAARDKSKEAYEKSKTTMTADGMKGGFKGGFASMSSGWNSFTAKAAGGMGSIGLKNPFGGGGGDDEAQLPTLADFLDDNDLSHLQEDLENKGFVKMSHVMMITEDDLEVLTMIRPEDGRDLLAAVGKLRKEMKKNKKKDEDDDSNDDNDDDDNDDDDDDDDDDDGVSVEVASSAKSRGRKVVRHGSIEPKKRDDDDDDGDDNDDDDDAGGQEQKRQPEEARSLGSKRGSSSSVKFADKPIIPEEVKAEAEEKKQAAAAAAAGEKRKPKRLTEAQTAQRSQWRLQAAQSYSAEEDLPSDHEDEVQEKLASLGEAVTLNSTAAFMKKTKKQFNRTVKQARADVTGVDKIASSPEFAKLKRDLNVVIEMGELLLGERQPQGGVGVPSTYPAATSDEGKEIAETLANAYRFLGLLYSEVVHRPQTQVVYLEKSVKYFELAGDQNEKQRTMVKILQRHVDTSQFVKAVDVAERIAKEDPDPVHKENASVMRLAAGAQQMSGSRVPMVTRAKTDNKKDKYELEGGAGAAPAAAAAAAAAATAVAAEPEVSVETKGGTAGLGGGTAGDEQEEKETEKERKAREKAEKKAAKLAEKAAKKAEKLEKKKKKKGGGDDEDDAGQDADAAGAAAAGGGDEETEEEKKARKKAEKKARKKAEKEAGGGGGAPGIEGGELTEDERKARKKAEKKARKKAEKAALEAAGGGDDGDGEETEEERKARKKAEKRAKRKAEKAAAGEGGGDGEETEEERKARKKAEKKAKRKAEKAAAEAAGE